jgi:hypothetical protein
MKTELETTPPLPPMERLSVKVLPVTVAVAALSIAPPPLSPPSGPPTAWLSVKVQPVTLSVAAFLPESV